LKAALVTLGAATTDNVSEPVAVVPAAFVAVTVQVPVPVPLVLTVRLPLVPVVLPLVVPEQDTLAEVAPVVVQEKVFEAPVVAYVALNAALDTAGAATTLAVSERVTLVPAALVAVAVQVTVPADAPAVTVKLPLVAEPLPEPDPAPVQLPDVDVAPEAVQLNVLAVLTVMLLTAMFAALSVGEATTVKLAEPFEELPAALVAVTVQVPVPVPAVDTVMLPEAPLPDPDAAPEQATETLVAPLVVQLKVLVPPVVVLALVNDLPVTTGAATTDTVGLDVTL
jgi:hypothetical protein